MIRVGYIVVLIIDEYIAKARRSVQCALYCS